MSRWLPISVGLLTVLVMVILVVTYRNATRAKCNSYDCVCLQLTDAPQCPPQPALPGEIVVDHNHGFFSCCSVSLRAIIESIRSTGGIPIFINVSNAFNEYKSSKATMQEWFVQPTHALAEVMKGTPHAQVAGDLFQAWYENDPYTFEPRAFQVVVSCYFRPTPEIWGIVDALKAKYGIDPSRSCYIYYRGTDKVSEMARTPVDVMLEKSSELHRSEDIIVQSDEPEFVQRVRERFANVTHVAELSARGGAELSERNRHSKILLACVLIASQCKRIVMTTGNVSLWMLLYRGVSSNVHQYYHPHGQGGRFIDLG